MHWVKVADAETPLRFNKENICEVLVQGRSICLARVKEELLAFSGICPHAGALLSKGYIDAKSQIVCPLHGFKFNLQSGKQSFGESYLLKIFNVKMEGGVIFVGFP